MDAYFVYSPFHFFNAINLKINENENEDADLYILDIFSGAKKLYSNVKKSSIFINVYLIDFDTMSTNKKIPVRGHIRLEKTLVNKIKEAIWFISNHNLFLTDRAYKGTCLYQKAYSKIFSAGDFLYLRKFYLYQIIKKKARCIWFDDGLGTRIKNKVYMSKKKRVLSKIGLKHINEFVENTYYYDCTNVVYANEQRAIKQESPVNFNEEKIKLLEKIYDYKKSENYLIEYDYIFFASGIQRYGRSISNALQYYKMEKELVAVLAEHIRMDDYLVKQHPAIEETYGKINTYIKQTIPTEALMMFTDLKDNVFIAIFSVVLYNCKYIYNQEPYIVLLYKIMNIDTVEMMGMQADEFEAINNRFLFDYYKDKSRIFIPETVEELLDNIEYIKLQKEKGK